MIKREFFFCQRLGNVPCQLDDQNIPLLRVFVFISDVLPDIFIKFQGSLQRLEVCFVISVFYKIMEYELGNRAC